ARSALDDLRAELAAERAARSAEAEHIADLERTAATGREELERLAREQAVAAAAQQPAEDPARLVADLDAAAAALRARTPEPIAPDAEPDSEDAEWPVAEAPAEPAVQRV